MGPRRQGGPFLGPFREGKEALGIILISNNTEAQAPFPKSVTCYSVACNAGVSLVRER